MISPASQPYLDEIRAKWDLSSQELFARDGTHPKFHKGGQDIKGNPALRRTMEAIAEAYIPHCARKAELYDARYECEGILTGAVESKQPDEEVLKRLDRVVAEIAALDAQLVCINKDSLARLYEPGSGLAREVDRQGEGRPSVAKLQEDVARKVISAVAKTVVGTCSGHLHAMGEEVDFIPRRFEPCTSVPGR
jgi:hypothetical protein